VGLGVGGFGDFMAGGVLAGPRRSFWGILFLVKKPGDGYCWPKHVVFLFVKNITSN